MELLVAHAVQLLTARPHSKAELAQKLARVCARRQRSKLLRFREPFENVNCGTAVAESIAELDRMQLVDDEHYASWHVEQRGKFRPRSRIQLRGELAAKGVPSAVASKAVEGANDLLSAYRLSARKPRASGDELLGFLARKGFSPHIALAVTRASPEERAARIADLTAAASEEGEMAEAAAAAAAAGQGEGPLQRG